MRQIFYCGTEILGGVRAREGEEMTRSDTRSVMEGPEHPVRVKGQNCPSEPLSLTLLQPCCSTTILIIKDMTLFLFGGRGSLGHIW